MTNRHERRKQLKGAKTGGAATSTVVAQRIGQVIALLKAGRLDQAEALCGEVLRLDSRQPDAHHLLGIVALQRGRLDEALAHLGRAVAVAPDFVEAHASLGTALARLGRHAEAVESFKRSLALRPDHGPTLVNLGIALALLGRFVEAEAAHRRVVELDPGYPEGYNNLGLVLRELGRLDEAEAAYRHGLALKANQPPVWSNLGTLLAERQRFDEAADAHRRAIALAPAYADARHNLGLVLQAQGDLTGAADCYREAIRLDAHFAAAPLNFGIILCDETNTAAIVAALEQSVQADPTNPDVLCNLGVMLRRQGRLGEALAHLRRSIALDPSQGNTWSNLGNALLQCGEFGECLAAHQRAAELAPDSAAQASDGLYALQYRPGVSAAALDRPHRGWDARFGGFPAPAHANGRDPERAPRIGFVSADFGRHPIGFFTLKLLENREPGTFTAVCYACDRRPDAVTERLTAAADEWHEVRDTADADLAERIRADTIDILFDMAGHTGRNRLPCFARKPAPIQITWAGYVGTTGLAAMDYLMADRFHVPEGEDVHYCERVLRMPNGYICYAPPEDAPEVAPLPAAANGFVTFGCFNNPAKINEPLLDAWGEIMKRVPGSRLFLKYGEMEDSVTRERVAGRLARHGIDPARLTFEGRSPHRDLLAAYGRVDVGLDTSPYSGGLTTCEALWMGVPVVTVTGATFAGRHSTSHLSNVGLTETIATDVAGYIETAVALANDRDRVAALRAGLRERTAASPLCDGPRFARDFEAAMRQVWRAWCAES